MAIFRVADAKHCNSRDGTSIWGFKLALRAISTLSRVYLSVGGEFSNWSEGWVLSVIMVLSSWSFNCSWFLGLAEDHLGMSLMFVSFQSNVMSIDRRAVFEQNTSMWKELLRTACSQL